MQQLNTSVLLLLALMLTSRSVSVNVCLCFVFWSSFVSFCKEQLWRGRVAGFFGGRQTLSPPEHTFHCRCCCIYLPMCVYYIYLSQCLGRYMGGKSGRCSHNTYAYFDSITTIRCRHLYEFRRDVGVSDFIIISTMFGNCKMVK